jgi:primase-polymerase (primpol)-like protein
MAPARRHPEHVVASSEAGALTRPLALTVNAASIPDALKRERRWVVWRGVLAKSDDPLTWCAFEEALAAYHTCRFDGVGFVLGDGWAGVDFDHVNCHVIAAAPLVDRLPCYREMSPGGNGLKAIGRADRVGGEIKFDLHASKPPTFTTWMGARFFTITGQDASGDPLADLSAFLDAWFAAPAPLHLSSTREGYALAAEASDDDLLIAMIANDINGDQILALWRGETSAYGGDHSRADQALVSHLAFWTNYDAERVDRLFRQSGLYRDKWDHASYRRATLGKACR